MSRDEAGGRGWWQRLVAEEAGGRGGCAARVVFTATCSRPGRSRSVYWSCATVTPTVAQGDVLLVVLLLSGHCTADCGIRRGRRGGCARTPPTPTPPPPPTSLPVLVLLALDDQRWPRGSTISIRGIDLHPVGHARTHATRPQAGGNADFRTANHPDPPCTHPRLVSIEIYM